MKALHLFRASFSFGVPQTCRNLSSQKEILLFNEAKASKVRFNRTKIRKTAKYSEVDLDEKDLAFLEDKRMHFDYQKNLAKIYYIYRHFFQGIEFTPSASLTVRYIDEDVKFGNFMRAQKATIIPEVSLANISNIHDMLSKKHSIFMVDLDGNHIDPLTEVTHWGLVNLDLVGSEGEYSFVLNSGHEIFTYVPPIPWQGTGDHRLLFVHCLQDEIIESENLKSLGVGDRFLFRCCEFINLNSLTPISMCWFQCSYDLSVSETCKRILNIPEPIFDRKREITFAEREAQYLKKLEYSTREAIGVETLRLDD